MKAHSSIVWSCFKQRCASITSYVGVSHAIVPEDSWKNGEHAAAGFDVLLPLTSRICVLQFS